MKTNNEEKLTICGAIDYEKDIAPFPLVKIYSGVGSGKSFFASKMITGSDEYGIPEQNILIITSRRSKVEETLKELGTLVKPNITINGNLSFEVWNTGEERPDEYERYLKTIKFVNDMGEHTILTYNKSAVCTNAFISAYLRYTYNPDDPTTHIWNKFDAIIIDEVHSLVTDATYQAATFDVLSLIHEYLRLYKNNQLQPCACKHLILMTGTPEPFEAFVKLDFPEEMTNRLDLFDKCKNIVPKNVILIDKQSAQKRIQDLLLSNQKVIYFSNNTSSESSAKDKFKIPDSVNIGVSFSSEDKRKKLSKDEQEKILNLNESLSKNSFIPDEIQFFVTTSRNKEGINIHNTDFHNMFVETHLMYDVVQMAGRVRSGIDNLYIISNADQFNDGNNITDILFSKKIMVANDDFSDSADESNSYLTSEYLKSCTKTEEAFADRIKNIMYYVKYIEIRFSYVRYNIFKQKFEFFTIKEKAERAAEIQRETFENMISSENNKFVERWFSKSNVFREISVKEQATIYLNSIIGSNQFIKVNKSELREHLSVICDLFDSKLTSPNPILHLVDENFNCKSIGSMYILYYGKEETDFKKKPMKRRKQ